jgi:tRNA(Leu) C34 or U34 (ribose-2'-O)-methylase TrmL
MGKKYFVISLVKKDNKFAINLHEKLQTNIENIEDSNKNDNLCSQDFLVQESEDKAITKEGVIEKIKYQGWFIKKHIKELFVRKDVLKFAKENGGIDFSYKDETCEETTVKIPVYYESTRWGNIAASAGIGAVFVPTTLASIALSIVNEIGVAREWLISNIVKSFVSDDKIIEDIMKFMFDKSTVIRSQIILVVVDTLLVLGTVLGIIAPLFVSEIKRSGEIDAIPEDHLQKEQFPSLKIGELPWCGRISKTDCNKNIRDEKSMQ